MSKSERISRALGLDPRWIWMAGMQGIAEPREKKNFGGDLCDNPFRVWYDPPGPERNPTTWLDCGGEFGTGEVTIPCIPDLADPATAGCLLHMLARLGPVEVRGGPDGWTVRTQARDILLASPPQPSPSLGEAAGRALLISWAVDRGVHLREGEALAMELPFGPGDPPAPAEAPPATPEAPPAVAEAPPVTSEGPPAPAEAPHPNIRQLEMMAQEMVNIPGWEMSRWECLDNGSLITGSTVGVFSRGPRKGQKKWASKSDPSYRQVSISSKDGSSWLRARELATGACGHCETKPGFELWGWGPGSERDYRTCRRCNGSGKAP